MKTGIPLSKSTLIDLSDNDNEADVDSWIEELKFRNSLLTNPFYKFDKNRITPLFNWRDKPEYFLCLFYAYYGANDKSGGTKLFEKISAQALKNFLGGEVYSLGFPEGKGLNEYIAEIAEKCKEKTMEPADGSYKDDRVDVVGYKLLDNYRGGNLYVLMQCAAGKHWSKKNPISLNRWTNYIKWYRDNIVSTISTVEFVSQKDMDKRNSDFGMVMDRVRIANFLYQGEIEEDLKNSTIDWCKEKITMGL